MRNTTEVYQKRKDYLKPYANMNDLRFNWLDNDFLKKLYEWKQNIENRQGQFSQNAKDHMFLLWKTLCICSY